MIAKIRYKPTNMSYNILGGRQFTRYGGKEKDEYSTILVYCQL